MNWTWRDRYLRNPAPPRRFCKNDRPHDRHLHEGGDGLIWACYGHNRKSTARPAAPSVASTTR